MFETSSSNSLKMQFDTFISFRGEDTRNTLVRHLYEELVELGISTFMEDNKLLIGDSLSEKVIRAIENSRSFIIVLSENYASSKWCLRELAKIIDRIPEENDLVLPVFYHVSLWDVGRQSGCLEKSFHEHEAILPQLNNMERYKYMEEVQQWRRALTRVAHLSKSVVVTQDRAQVTHIIYEITKRLFQRFVRHQKLVPINKLNELVDFGRRLSKMDELIDLKLNEVCFIGIIGMSGIGKTTIAEVFYDKVAYMFGKNRCFLRINEHATIVSLQQQLLFQLLGTKDIIINNENEGARMIESCLRNKKVFIVLDGVKENGQLEKLVGSPHWFGKGSKIIITTRKRDVLRRQLNYKDQMVEYKVDFLSNFGARELFWKHAMKIKRPFDPNENFEDLIKEIVEKVKGHPLALKTIGSLLCGQSIDTWKQVLNDKVLLGENLYIDAFRTSYEELDVQSKEIFLDLVCFFSGERVEVVKKILVAVYDTIYIKLNLLMDRCLIEIVDDKIHIEFLILSLGRRIVREMFHLTRIWERVDVSRVFQDKIGLHKIHGIKVLDDEDEELELDPKSFSYMRNLKLLEISNVKLSQHRIEFLSNQLRMLKWLEFPLSRFPSSFHPRFMAQLILPQSKLQVLWEGSKHFAWLREIDVSDSKYLVVTPDLSRVPNLERLIFRNCSRLKEIHSSITNLSRLVYLDLVGCKSLTMFPPPRSQVDKILVQYPNLTHLNLKNCTKLSSLPTSMGSLTSLATLNLNGCKNLAQIPPSLWTLNSLVQLDIGGTLVKLPPSSFPFSMQKLQIINLEKLYGSIWISFSSLITSNRTTYGPHCIIRDLNLSYCNLVDEDIPHDLTSFSTLEILDLSGNHFVTLSQSLTQLINLKVLYLNHCNKLKELPMLLPTNLRYVGGLNRSLYLFPNNNSHTGSSTDTSSRLLSNNPHMMGKEYSSEPNTNFNKMEQPKSSNLVGMEEQLEKVTNLLDVENNNEVIFLGILGMSGIGKTSLARVVYEKIASKFESSCFLHISKQSNLASLQHQLLSQLLVSKAPIKVGDDHKNNNFGDDEELVKKYVNGRKVVIVLDGVDEDEQIEKLSGLARSPDWFFHGSRVIITSSNRKVLFVPTYEHKMVEYNVALLDEAAALQLFSKHAFTNDHPPNQEFKDLSHKIIRKLGRLPLALKGVGSFLYHKDIDIWKETLIKLSKVEEDFFSIISEKVKVPTLGSRCLP